MLICFYTKLSAGPGLAVQAVADDLLPADDEAAGVVLVLALALQVGFELGPDGLGLGLQLLLLGLNSLELGDAVVQLTVGHGGNLLFVLVWGRGRESVSRPAYSGNAFPRPWNWELRRQVALWGNPRRGRSISVPALIGHLCSPCGY